MIMPIMINGSGCCAALSLIDHAKVILMTLGICSVLYCITHVSIYGIPYYKNRFISIIDVLRRYIRRWWHRNEDARELDELLVLSGLSVEEVRKNISLSSRVKRRLKAVWLYIMIGVCVLLVRLGIIRK